MQSIDSIETYACGTRKNLMRKKKETKFNNLIKQYKSLLTLMVLQKKT